MCFMVNIGFWANLKIFGGISNCELPGSPALRDLRFASTRYQFTVFSSQLPVSSSRKHRVPLRSHEGVFI